MIPTYAYTVTLTCGQTPNSSNLRGLVGNKNSIDPHTYLPFWSWSSELHWNEVCHYNDETRYGSDTSELQHCYL
uniref:Uncharacterized protein n=1 Tax=Anguilla anguilla TaxID=7936 RepID=A0A0E9VJ54_ANGAN